jgi:hypothetical protein
MLLRVVFAKPTEKTSEATKTGPLHEVIRA